MFWLDVRYIFGCRIITQTHIYLVVHAFCVDVVLQVELLIFYALNALSRFIGLVGHFAEPTIKYDLLVNRVCA